MLIKSLLSSVSLNAAIFLLIFCLEDLSIVHSGVLKSTTMTALLSISFLKSTQIFVMYLGAPNWEHICLQGLYLLVGLNP